MDKLITYNREMIKTLQNRLLHLLELRTGKFSFDFCDQNFANLEPLLSSNFVVPWHANLSLNHLKVSECHARSFRNCFCPIIRMLGSSSLLFTVSNLHWYLAVSKPRFRHSFGLSNFFTCIITLSSNLT